MLKRFLSHALIGIATFVLSATFFIWVVDARVLDSSVLNGELRKAGVSQEIANLMPQIVTEDDQATMDEKLMLMEQVSRAVDANYVEQKIFGLSDAMTTYIKTGEPVVLLDLRDFPDRLANAGVDVDGAIRDSFDEQVLLQDTGVPNALPTGYKAFSAVKWAGIFVFVGLLLLEWLLVEKGKKLRRISRIFLYAGVSYLIYWAILVLSPGRLGAVLQQNVQAAYDTTQLIDAILRAIQGLFSAYFLSFALACLSIALTMYAIRYYRDGDVMTQGTAPVEAKKTNQKKK